jgi:hypothetical protein
VTGLEQLHALIDALDWSLYSESDRDAVRKFRCAPFGDKPAKAAQKMIRGAPDAMENFGVHPVFILAKDNGDLVGAVIFGPESENAEVVTVFSLGVKLQRHREGIGTLLKGLAMAAAARRDNWPNAVASQVHRNNYKMIGVNDKLGVESDPDPEDGEFLITAVKVELPPSEPSAVDPQRRENDAE